MREVLAAGCLLQAAVFVHVYCHSIAMLVEAPVWYTVPMCPQGLWCPELLEPMQQHMMLIDWLSLCDALQSECTMLMCFASHGLSHASREHGLVHAVHQW
jgi:hypothetical protein